MIITKTPFRVSFFGGGTDYNHWFERNGGLVINSTFSQYNFISIRPIPPSLYPYKSKLIYSKIEEVMDNADITHPSARNCLQYLGIKDGLEIQYDSDLPARSGIGSSSSFTVGMLCALYAYKREEISKIELAKKAIYVEQKLLQENVGIQDQIAASVGGFNMIKMEPGKEFQVLPLSLNPDFKKYFESHVMLGFSGQTRISSHEAKIQIRNIENGKNINQLTEIMDIAYASLKPLKEDQDLEKVGYLLDQAWKIKRSLTSSMSNDLIDKIYSTAIMNGAFGGKLLGAGNGGFLLFIAPPEKHQRIKEALKGMIKVWTPFQFEDDGTQFILNQNKGEESNLASDRNVSDF